MKEVGQYKFLFLSIDLCKFSASDSRCSNIETETLAIPSLQRDDWSVGEEVNYTCPDNHKLRGESKLRCNVGGQWSSEYPSCESKYLIRYFLNCFYSFMKSKCKQIEDKNYYLSDNYLTFGLQWGNSLHFLSLFSQFIRFRIETWWLNPHTPRV